MARTSLPSRGARSASTPPSARTRRALRPQPPPPARLPRGCAHGLRCHRGGRDQRYPRPPGAHGQRRPRRDRHLERRFLPEQPEPLVLAALFDFDGTLVDTTEMIFQSMRHATSSVLGRDDLSREELLANVGQPLPRPLGRSAAHTAVPPPAPLPPDEPPAPAGQPLPRQMELFDAEKADLLLEAYRTHHEEHHDALIAEFPGVYETLNRLRTAGVRIIVVTSKRRRSVEMALEKFPGLGLVVDLFVTLEDTTEHKPHPEPLLKGLELAAT